MRFITLCAVVLLLSVVACDNSVSDRIEISPDTPIDAQLLTLSVFADDITYIPLPAGRNFALTTGNNIFVANNLIYISTDDGVYSLDINGSFVRSYGKQGRGPGEYLSGSFTAIDDNTGDVFVNDYRVKEIKVFAANGEYKRTINLKEKNIETFNNFYILDSKLFLLFYPIGYAENIYDWMVIDTVGNVLSVKESTTPTFEGKMSRGSSFKYDNTVGYWNIYEDTVYRIYPSMDYEPSIFYVTPGNHREPKYSYRLPSMSPEEYGLAMAKYFNPTTFIETDNYFFYRDLYQIMIDKNSRSVYSTSKNDSILTNAAGFQSKNAILNDVDNGGNFQIRTYYKNGKDEYLIGTATPYSLIQLVSSEEFEKKEVKYPEKKEALKAMVDTLSENDNPIVMLVKLK